MPALRVFGRSWYTTSDMLPIPAILIGTNYLVYVIVFGVSIAGVGVWTKCTGSGTHYQIATAGLITVFGLSFILQAGMLIGGSRGTIFELSKRRICVVLLYIQAIVWAAQFGFMVYGTYVLYRNHIQPLCGVTKEHHRQLRALAHAMVWGTWGQAIFFLILFYILFNSYQGKTKIEAWEERLRFLAGCLCCTDVVAPKGKKARSGEQPLMSIANWISGLFAGVELSPSDLMTAVFLTAAVQNMRRKMRIRRALEDGAQDYVSTTVADESDSDSDSKLDEFAEEWTVSRGTLTAQLDSESSFRSSAIVGSSPRSQRTANGGKSPVALHQNGVAAHGLRLLGDHPHARERQQTEVAIPVRSERQSSDESDDLSSVATNEDFQEPAAMIGSDVPADSKAATQSDSQASVMREDTPFRRPRWQNSSEGLLSSEQIRTSEFVEGAEEPLTISDFTTNAPSLRNSGERHRMSRESRSSMEGAARDGSGHKQRHKMSTSTDSRGSAEIDLSKFVKLSQVNEEELAEFTKNQHQGGDQPTPTERFGIDSKTKNNKGQPKNEEQASHDHRESRDVPMPLQGRRTSAERRSPKVAHHSPQQRLASRMLSLDLQSSTLGREMKPTGSMEVLPGELGGLQDEVIEFPGMEEQQVVPLEKDKSNHIPPIITPSEEVTQAAAPTEHVGSILNVVHGVQRRVEYNVLEEANNWARFATAVYAVMPFTEEGRLTKSKRRCCGIRSGITEEGVRDSVVDIAGIETDDLLYFSHSNVALSHLPYMVALDRKSKAVVVAVRGTMSLADLVTDAVVEPSHLNEWMPAETRKAKQKAPGGNKKAYGHSGILSAAEAVLADLKANGILTTLLQPEGVRKKSLEIQKRRRSLAAQPVSQAMSRSSAQSNGSLESKRRQKMIEAEEDASSSEAEHTLSDAENGDAGPKQKQCGEMRRNTKGKQAGGVWPSPAFPKKDSKAPSGNAKEQQGDEMAEAAQNPAGSPEEQGEQTGEALRKNLDTEGWKLVLTGHSLGGGAATLLALRMLSRYPDLKCWAFSPPGGLISRSCLRWSDQWCTSVVVGKDAVPRMTLNNVSRLMDEMVTSLARCRHHKLRILLGGWRGEKGTVPKNLFFAYADMPEESRAALDRYLHRANKREVSRDMFPAGRLLFLRPIKLKTPVEKHEEDKKVKQAWDAVWQTPEELIAEGILVSKKMLAHHSITNALIPALGYSMRHHPFNPKSKTEKRQDKHEENELRDGLDSVKDDAAPNPLSDATPL